MAENLNLDQITALIKEKEIILKDRLYSNNEYIQDIAIGELEAFKVTILRKILITLDFQSQHHLDILDRLKDW